MQTTKQLIHTIASAMPGNGALNACRRTLTPGSMSMREVAFPSKGDMGSGHRPRDNRLLLTAAAAKFVPLLCLAAERDFGHMPFPLAQKVFRPCELVENDMETDDIEIQANAQALQLDFRCETRCGLDVLVL